jgi:hypothetical protein
MSKKMFAVVYDNQIEENNEEYQEWNRLLTRCFSLIFHRTFVILFYFSDTFDIVLKTFFYNFETPYMKILKLN